MNETLAELLLMKVPDNIGIAGCISTTVVSDLLTKYLSKSPTGEGKVHNFLVELTPAKDGPNPGDIIPGTLSVLSQDSTDAMGLQDVGFVTNVLRTLQQRYDYDHVILHTWDHGSGFAIFPSPDTAEQGPTPGATVIQKPMPAAMAAKMNAKAVAGASPEILAIQKHLPGDTASAVVRNPDHGRPVHRLFKQANLVAHAKQLSVPELSNLGGMLKDLRWTKPAWGLTMDNLKEAILGSFGKVDIIFMRNCYMQTFDTGFTLKDVADYLVATEGVMWFPTYDYDVWLAAMLEPGALDSSDVMVRAAIKGLTAGGGAPTPDTAMFGNDLSFYPALNYKMNQMITELIGYVQQYGGALKDCRQKIKDIVEESLGNANFQLIDASLWFNTAATVMKDNNRYQEALKDFLALRDRMVAGRCSVGAIMAGNDYGTSGFSLYFPKDDTQIKQYMSYYQLYYALNSSYRSDFTNYSLWDEFIGYLLLGLPPSTAIPALPSAAPHEEAAPVQ